MNIPPCAWCHHAYELHSIKEGWAMREACNAENCKCKFHVSPFVPTYEQKQTEEERKIKAAVWEEGWEQGWNDRVDGQKTTNPY